MDKTIADWSLLPYDVLSEVVLKLETVEDFVYFSAVCHEWNYAASMIKLKWSSKIPWLLLAENTKDNHDYCRKLFSLNRNRCYGLKLPHTFGARCWGSPYGWIVVFDLNLQISLFNPLTQAQIFLPSQSTMPNQIEVDSDSDSEVDSLANREWLVHVFIRKAFVWKMTNDDLLVIAIHGNTDRALAFARPGDQVWTPIITPEEDDVHDIVYWAGQMLIMYSDGALRYCDLSGACSLQPLKAIDYLQAPRGILDKLRRRINELYMVDSFGDLLMVLRYKIDMLEGEDDDDDDDDDDYDDNYSDDDDDDDDDDYNDEDDKKVTYKTRTFEVFRLNFETKEWEQLKDIGDVALFVGDNCSMSIRASNANNCKRNCIYFTDDEFQFWSAPTNFGGHDIGIFDMESQKFQAFYQGDDLHSKICTPLWFNPSFS